MTLSAYSFHGLGAIPTVPKWSNTLDQDPLYTQIQRDLTTYETLARSSPDASKKLSAQFDAIVKDFQKELAVRPNRDAWEWYDRAQDEKRLNFMIQKIDRLRQDLENAIQNLPSAPPPATEDQADESGLSDVLEKNDPFYPKEDYGQKELSKLTSIPWWGYAAGVAVVGGLVWWRYSVIKRRR